jgi:hypothetical protein
LASIAVYLLVSVFSITADFKSIVLVFFYIENVEIAEPWDTLLLAPIVPIAEDLEYEGFLSPLLSSPALVGFLRPDETIYSAASFLV